MKKSCHVEARGRLFQEDSMHALKQTGRWTQMAFRLSSEGLWVPQMDMYHPSGQQRWKGHQTLAPSVSIG